MVSLEPSWGTSCHCSKAQQLLSPRCKQPSRRSNRRGAKRATPSGWAATTAVAAACRFFRCVAQSPEFRKYSPERGGWRALSASCDHTRVRHRQGSLYRASHASNGCRAPPRPDGRHENSRAQRRAAAYRSSGGPPPARKQPKMRFQHTSFAGVILKEGRRTVSAHHSVFAGVILKAGVALLNSARAWLQHTIVLCWGYSQRWSGFLEWRARALPEAPGAYLRSSLV